MKKLDTFSKQVDKHLKKMDMLGLGKSEVYLEGVNFHGMDDVSSMARNKILKKQKRYRRHLFQLFHFYFSERDAKELYKILLQFHSSLRKQNPGQTFKDSIEQWKKENLDYWRDALERKEEDPDLSLLKKLRNAWLTMAGKIIITSIVILMLFFTRWLFMAVFGPSYDYSYTTKPFDYQAAQKVADTKSDTLGDMLYDDINLKKIKFTSRFGNRKFNMKSKGYFFPAYKNKSFYLKHSLFTSEWKLDIRQTHIYRYHKTGEALILAENLTSDYSRSGTRIYYYQGKWNMYKKHNQWRYKKKLLFPGIYIVCYDLVSRKILWRKKVKASLVWDIAAPVLYKNKMLVCLYNQIFILNRINGAILKIIKVPFPVRSNPNIIYKKLHYYGNRKMVIFG